MRVIKECPFSNLLGRFKLMDKEHRVKSMLLKNLDEGP